MNKPPASALVIALFALGLLGGIGVEIATNVGVAANPYASLPPAPEPQASAVVAQAIRQDDPRMLSRVMSDQDLLNKLHQSLDPIIAVSDVRFLGAADRNGTTLSAYVVRGRDQQGNKIIRGFVLSVQHGEVVGVN